MMKKIDKRACRKSVSQSFPISMNNGLLYLESVEYIVRVKMSNIAGKRILLLYFCAVKDVKDGKLIPKYVVFQAKDEFITLEYCEDGKTKWRQVKTNDLGKRYHSFLPDCAFYSHKEELMVIRFCNKQKESGIQSLEALQLNLACKREQSRKRAREAKIRERMKGVNLLPKKSIQQWLQNEVFPAHIFYYYKKGAKTQTGYCTHCRKKVELLSPRHGKEIVCPSCGWKATAHAQGRNANVYERTTALYLQKHGKELLVRVCKASASYKDFHNPQVSVWENARFFIKAEGKKLTNESYYYSFAFEKLTPWTKGVRPCFNRWAYYFEADICGHVYTKNLKKVLKDTPWQYCQLKDYYLSDRKCMDIIPYLREYLSHPTLEYLVKLRLYNLATFAVYRDKGYLLGEIPLNMDGRNIKEVLGIDKKYLSIMQEVNINRSTFGLMKKMLEHSLPIDSCFLKWCQENKVHDVDALDRCLKYTSSYKLIRYLQQQSEDIIFAPNPYSSETPVKRAFDAYKDYIRFCEDLEYDLTDDFILFPRHLKDAHDRASEMFDKQEVEIYDKKIAAEYTKWVEQYQMTKYGFTVLPPKTSSEIVDEGHALHHCVGGYVSRVANKECVILFLRDAKKPDTPLYTIEVINGRVAQIRGENNCNPPPNVQMYMKAWERTKLIPAVSEQAAA